MKYREILEIRESIHLEGINALLKKDEEKWIYLGWERVRSILWIGEDGYEKKPLLVDKITHIIGRIE